MSEGLVRYELDGNVALITMDDGKVNVLGPPMFAALNEAVDQAEAAGAAIVLAGRSARFCAGFDIKVLGSFGPEAPVLLRTGFEFAHRLLSYPRPVVIACSGHAFAMGVFLLLTADYRVGPNADVKITANEVAIGLTMPRAAIELCRSRLTRAHFERAVNQAEMFDAEGAVAAGFLDELVAPDAVVPRAVEKASGLMALNLGAFVGTKARTRQATLAALAEAIEVDDKEFRATIGAPTT